VTCRTDRKGKANTYRTEFANLKLDVSDVDHASANFQELFSIGDAHDSADIERIAAARILDLSEEGDPTISGAYDAMLQTWVEPLPPEVPIRVRQHKERLARRVAAELVLSSTRIRSHELQEPIDASQRGPSQDSGVALPILPSKPREGTFDTPSPWSFSQQLPTPPYSSIPSSSFPASLPPAPTYAAPAPPNPISRLSKHFRLRETPVTLVPNVAQVLAHFEHGAHPHTYDWTATERALQSEDLDEESQQQREKERKRKQRKEKRQQRQDELMRAKAFSRPAVFPRSSPGPMLGGMGSSSQMPTQMSSQVPLSESGFRGPGGRDILGPQSQVEPGKFGGRLDKKKKKKGRVSGF
jgi:RNA polymerase I-specific transcription initiation factor RRN6